MTAHIDTDSEPGAWAETLASPSCKIITQHRQQIGLVAVTFTMGRIVPKQKQGGGLCVSAHNHEVTYGE